ncbi:MAG: exodeoxyribonuclease VII large subunit [Beijerinckiaceae bacterium]|nr:exodeoxyribonuclease VII large subunit [Beijerinckiaceae bacterium]
MDQPVTNTPELSVSELAGALKRTIEDAFGQVRLRGEISGYRGPHSSGHVYFSLKDQNAKIDAVIWKGVFSRIKFRPEDGLEVVAIGRITTFPGKSSYQIIIEQMEPAGVGALMALLEERRRKLQGEGLFDATRKRALPYLPQVIGIVTSPTGAVIRDMIHRLSDRFPCTVLVWPVRVQGEGSAAEVAAGIRGFNAIGEEDDLPRPDVLVVARGGGSLEDLWSFNEEIVVRAAAESTIPLVSAIGHETDWTLLDLVADIRAPTPTAAAEMVVPVRVDLLADLRDRAARLAGSMARGQDRRRRDLANLARAMGSAERLLESPAQRLDRAILRLDNALRAARDRRSVLLANLARRLGAQKPEARLARFRERVAGLGERLRGIGQRQPAERLQRLEQLGKRLEQAMRTTHQRETREIARRKESLASLARRLPHAMEVRGKVRKAALEAQAKLLESLAYKNVLARGYAVIRQEDRILSRREGLETGQAISIEFADGRIDAVTGGSAASGPRPARKPASGGGQGSLF